MPKTCKYIFFYTTLFYHVYTIIEHSKYIDKFILFLCVTFINLLFSSLKNKDASPNETLTRVFQLLHGINFFFTYSRIFPYNYIEITAAINPLIIV